MTFSDQISLFHYISFTYSYQNSSDDHYFYMCFLIAWSDSLTYLVAWGGKEVRKSEKFFFLRDFIDQLCFDMWLSVSKTPDGSSDVDMSHQ